MKKIFMYQVRNEIKFLIAPSKHEAWMSMGSPDRQAIVRVNHDIDPNKLLTEVEESDLVSSLMQRKDRVQQLEIQLRELSSEIQLNRDLVENLKSTIAEIQFFKEKGI